MNVSRFSLSSNAYSVPLASTVAMVKLRTGKEIEPLVATEVDVQSPSTPLVAGGNKAVSAGSTSPVLTQAQSVQEKKQKKTDWLPSAVAVGLVATAATAGVLLPQWLEENKTLEQRHKNLMTKLSSMKPYTPEEFGQVRERSIEILGKLPGSEGDKWLKEQPQTKGFLASLVNRTPENLENSYQAYKRQLIMECLNNKYGKFTLIKSDVDGTAEFKDFNNFTSGVSELTPANFSLGMGYELSSRAKNKAALEFGAANAGKATFQLAYMVNEMKELGMYGATAVEDGKVVLADPFSEVMLTKWTENTQKSFKTLKGKALERFMEGVSMALVTARAGGSGTVFEASSPNHITGLGLGKDNNYQYRPFGGAPQLLKMDPTNCYNHVNVYGIGGAYVVDRQLICPLPFADSSLFGLPDMLIKAGILDAIYNSSESPLRQIEPKGVLTNWMKEIMVDYLATKVVEIEKAPDVTTRLNALFDVLASQSPDKVDVISGQSHRTLMKETLAKQWADAGKNGNPTKEALLNRYYMASEIMHDFALPQAWEGKMNQVFEVALDAADKIDKGIAVTGAGTPTTMAEVGAYLKNNTRALGQADYTYFNAPFIKAEADEEGEVDFFSHPERVAYAKKATDSVLAGDNAFQAPVSKNQLAQIEALAQKGASLTLDDVKKLNKNLMTVDVACLTAHTIEAELNGLFVDIKKAEALFAKSGGKNPTDIKSMILETQKWEVLKKIIALENNPEIKEQLGKLGYAGILRVSSSDKKLCYPATIDTGARYLINMVNNSSALNMADYLQDSHYDAQEIEKMVKEAGVFRLADPTGSYVESVLNQALDKGAVLNFNNTLSVLEAFAGDSTGTDRAAMCDLLAKTPIHTSIRVRNMITYPQMLAGIVDSLNIEAGTCGNLLKAYKKHFKKNNLSEDHIKDILGLNEEQMKANPLRYKFQKIRKKDDNNVDIIIEDANGQFVRYDTEPSKKYLLLVGDGHEALLPFFKNKGSDPLALDNSEVAIHIDDFTAMVKQVYPGLFMERCIGADDVPFNRRRTDFVLDMIQGKAGWGHDFDTFKDLMDNHYLAQRAILFESKNPSKDSPAAFYRKNPFAFALGMPTDATFASTPFLPKNLAELEANPTLLKKVPNVFGWDHMLALSIGRRYLDSNAIGGLMAITGGAIAIGTALFQLVSVWNKPIVKLPSAPIRVSSVAPVVPATMLNNNLNSVPPVLVPFQPPAPSVLNRTVVKDEESEKNEPTDVHSQSTTSTATNLMNAGSNAEGEQPIQFLSKQVAALKQASTYLHSSFTPQSVSVSSLSVLNKDFHRRVAGYQQQPFVASADASTFSTKG